MVRRLLIDNFVWSRSVEPHAWTDAAIPTRRTHYNPAFWLALWNEEFYNSATGKIPRVQRVWALNLRGDSIYSPKAEQVHVEENLGLATMAAAGLIRIAEAKLPPGEKRDATIRELREFGDMTLDSENFFSAIEKMPIYSDTTEVIRQQNICTEAQRQSVATFLVSRRYRHPSTVALLHRFAREQGWEPWVAAIEIRKLFAMPEWTMKEARLLMRAHWTFHVSQEHLFPLPDYAVVGNEGNSHFWAALSPRVLLEVQTNVSRRKLLTKRVLDPEKDRSLLENYRRLSLLHAAREIVCPSKSMAEAWRDTFEYRERRKELGYKIQARD